MGESRSRERLGVRLRRRVNGIVVVLGLVLSLPVIAIVGRIRIRAAQAVARGATRCVSRACGISYTVAGLEHLDTDRTYVFVPNHSSPADIPAMLIIRDDLRFVAAAELFRIPLLSSAMRALGAVPVDRKRPSDARHNLEDLAQSPGAGSVVVFAEGGIPRLGEQRRFKSGAFVLAIQGGLPVVPVTIRGSADVLPRGRRVWARPGRIVIQLHEPIDTKSLTFADRHVLRDRTQAAVRAPLADAA